jgi:thioredoxin 1
MITVKRFTASWCAPCRALAPVISSLEPEFPDVQFETVDIETDTEVTQQYAVRTIPTVVILNNGVEVDRLIGSNPKQKYIDAITKAEAI